MSRDANATDGAADDQELPVGHHVPRATAHDAGADPVLESLRVSVAAVLLENYVQMDRLERRLTQLRADYPPPGEKSGEKSSETPGGLEIAAEAAPMDLRVHIGTALALVPGLLGAAGTGTGAVTGVVVGAVTGAEVLDNLQRNLLVTMESVAALLLEVTLHGGLSVVEVMGVADRAKAALDTFIADPAACEAVRAPQRSPR